MNVIEINQSEAISFCKDHSNVGKKMKNEETKKKILKLKNVRIPLSKVDVFRGHTKVVLTGIWHPCIDIFATTSMDKTVRLWDFRQTFLSPIKKTEAVLAIHGSNGLVQSLEWNPSGNMIATGSYNGNINLLSDTGEFIASMEKHTDAIATLGWSRNGKYIVSGGRDANAFVWDISTTKCIKQFNSHSLPILNVDWQSDTTFASCSSDKLINVQSINSNNTTTFKGHQKSVNVVQWNPQGNLLASGSDDKTVKIWSVGKESSLISLEEHIDHVHTIKWSPTGSNTKNPGSSVNLVSADYSNTAKIWDIETGVCINNIVAKDLEIISSISFSPNGKFIATGSFNSYIRIWSADQTERPLFRFRANSGIFEVCWNSKGNKIAAVTTNGTVLCIDLKK